MVDGVALSLSCLNKRLNKLYTLNVSSVARAKDRWAHSFGFDRKFMISGQLYVSFSHTEPALWCVLISLFIDFFRATE